MPTSSFTDRPVYPDEDYERALATDLPAYLRGELVEKTHALMVWEERLREARVDYQEWLELWQLKF